MSYSVILSDRMLIALVDIAQDYQEGDSPRYHVRTQEALLRRALVVNKSGKFKLTAKGTAYLEMALFEYARAGKVEKAKRAATKEALAESSSSTRKAAA